MIPLLVAFVGTSLASWSLTGVVRRYALHQRILDLPTPRSSHSVATPRGGGLALGIAALATIAAAAWTSWLDREVALALCGGGTLVVGIGWLEDRQGVPKLARLAVHAAAAGWALAWIGGMPRLGLGDATLQLGSTGTVLAVIGIVGTINIYNFMDGIDGLAGAEAVAVGAIGAVLLVLGHAPGLAVAAAAIGGSSLGFLFWNWPPARIFMGDSGSGLLGFLFATLAIASENAGALPALAWAILLGVFAVDGVVTIVRRAWHRQRVHEAHRQHAYQRLVQSGIGHGAVTRGALLLNLVLGLIALGAVRGGWIWQGALGAFVLLVTAYLYVDRVAPFDARG